MTIAICPRLRVNEQKVPRDTVTIIVKNEKAAIEAQELRWGSKIERDSGRCLCSRLIEVRGWPWRRCCQVMPPNHGQPFAITFKRDFQRYQKHRASGKIVGKHPRNLFISIRMEKM